MLFRSFGSAPRFRLEVFLPDEQSELHFDLRLFDQTASRIPQASWCSFQPMTVEPNAWRIEKLGQWISPLEVIARGNRTLHATGRGVKYEASDGTMLLETFDAPLVAPGAPALLRFQDQQPRLEGGMHFNLHNNVWGTNFPAWYEGASRFRFVLRIDG